MISIHALHEESDVTSAATRSACSIFQSTLSMRRATAVALQNPAGVRFQSTLSMRRATQCARHCTQSCPIPIPALHEESDRQYRRQRAPDQISIHALHEESDTTQAVPQSDCSAISIHALHEESDQDLLDRTQDMELFQSTLSMRRATGHVAVVGDLDRISIHALHEESDPILKPNTIRTDISIQLSMRRATRAAHVRHGGTINFNPRSP